MKNEIYNPSSDKFNPAKKVSISEYKEVYNLALMELSNMMRDTEKNGERVTLYSMMRKVSFVTFMVAYNAGFERGFNYHKRKSKQHKS